MAGEVLVLHVTRDACAVQVTQLVCVLPANIAHMKLYLLLCCWLAALATAGAAQLGHRLLTLASPAYRWIYLLNIYYLRTTTGLLLAEIV